MGTPLFTPVVGDDRVGRSGKSPIWHVVSSRGWSGRLYSNCGALLDHTARTITTQPDTGTVVCLRCRAPQRARRATPRI